MSLRRHGNEKLELFPPNSFPWEVITCRWRPPPPPPSSVDRRRSMGWFMGRRPAICRQVAPPPPPPAQRPFSFNFAPFHATSWHSPLLLIWFDWFMLSFVFFVMAVCVCVCVCVCVVEMVCYLIGSSRQLISNRWRYRGVSLINFIVVSREILRSWSRLSINYAHQLIDSSIHGMAMFLFMLMSPCCLLLALLQPPPQ